MAQKTVLTGNQKIDAVKEAVGLHEIYNRTAKHFNKTRHSIWTSTQSFVESLPSGSYVGDIGCGNGKNMMIRDDIKSKGCDFSEELVKICLDKGLDCVTGNVMDVPFKDNEFDHTMCVAVIHHLPTDEERIKAIKELIRITKNGGKIFIQVWANINKNKSDEQDRLVRWELDKRYNFGNNTETFMRYYHFFNQGELDDISMKAGNVKICESYDTCDNFVVILEVNK
jgi:ubiquinone/menaquinone biosynthesis C-methylase UbiE